MILELPDPSQVVLQINVQDPDGTPKTNVVSGNVRVYSVDNAGAETEELASTSLVQVGTSSTWRYVWEPSSLVVGAYIAEFTVVDGFGLTGIFTEDVVIQDFATESTLALVQADLEIVRKVETGRWKVSGNQMTFYEDDGVTPLLVFDLKDQAGLPTMGDVFERVKTP